MRLDDKNKVSHFSALTQVVLLTAFYFIGGMLGHLGAFGSGEIALVWPPAGIALAAILIFGYRFWPGVAAGAVLFSLMDGKPFGFFTFATAIGNTMAAVTSTYLLDRLIGFKRPISRLADAAGFVVIAALGASTNAAFNVTGLLYTHMVTLDDMFVTIMNWWVPNALGTIAVTPLLLSWAYNNNTAWTRKKITEAGICLASVVLTAAVSFNSWFFHGLSSYPMAFLPFPFLVWSALRFGLRGAMTCNAILATTAIAELLKHQGPFYTGNETTSLMLVGSYIGVSSCLSLLLAGGTAERDETERALAAREQEYRAIVEEQFDLICRFKPDGTLTFVNQAYCRFYKTTPDKLIGTNFFDELREEDREVPLLQFQSLSTGRPHVSFDNRVYIDGRVFWQQCTVHALFDDRDRIAGFQAVMQDVTARKESEERLKAILNNLAAAVVVVSPDGHITLFNPLAERIFARDLVHAIGEPVSILFPNSDFELYQNYIARRKKKNGSAFLELAALLPTGETLPVEMAATEIQISGHDLQILLLRDISERKQLELQSQKMEAIGQLTGGIAHDFNNLTQAILGYACLLNDRLTADDPNREPVVQIKRSVEQATALTRQLLTFSRKQDTQRKLISVNKVVSEMNSLLKRWIGTNIHLHMMLSETRLLVSADAGQIQQVLMNLAINARDAMFGTGRLTITTEPFAVDATNLRQFKDLKPGSYVALRITDTGCGMTPEIKARIFEAFFTTKEAGKGTGLGLSIVHNVVQQSGGEITVDSTPGVGTTFNIYLPRAEGELSADTTVTRRINPTGTETLLLVEDEALVREMFEAVLTAKGYTVITAGDGLQALKASNTHDGKVDLIITDLTLPELSGWELADRIAKARGLTPVLYISGYSTEDVAKKLENAGPCDFLQKPFTPETLLVKIRTLLDKHQSRS